MNHADFRVGGKIFATLGPDEDWGMVNVPTKEQAALVADAPDVFEAFNGAWGRSGCTRVWLKRARVAMVRGALLSAWRKRAPADLLDALG